MTSRPPLAVIIVSYRTRDALDRCLRALRTALPAGAEVIVVDNASADGSAELVRREHPSVDLIALETNRGFAAGVNAGVAASTAPLVLVLNPDVEVEQGALERLLRTAADEPRAAGVSPLLIGDDGRPQSWLYRRFPTLPQVLLFWTSLAPLARRIPALRRRWLEHDTRARGVLQVDQLPGGAMLLRRDALDAIGPLDEDYFMWFEDVDWSTRARYAGHLLLVDTRARWRHEGGASFHDWALDRRIFQFYRAGLRFLGMHAAPGLVAVAAAVIPADFALRSALLRLAGRKRELDGRRARVAIRWVAGEVRRGRLPEFNGPEPGDMTTPAAHSGLPTSVVPARDDGTDAADVDVIVINWNGAAYLPRCLDALLASSARMRVIVVDNASDDGSVDYIRRERSDVELVRLRENRGYAGAANEGLRRATSRYAFLMNPDLLVEPDHLAVLRDRLDADTGIGAAQGKLYQVDAESFAAGGRPPCRLLDSAGQRIARGRMVFDRGQGEPDEAQYDAEASVFSACGAGLFLRRAMLDDVGPRQRWLDEAFFAYKEDIDLCWRARLFGWDVRYVPAAVAHHVRALPGPGRRGRGAPAFARRHSWMNHWLMILKNDRPADLLRHAPWLLGWEVLRFGHALLRDPALLPAYIAIWKRVPGALRDRRFIQTGRRVGGNDMRRWFGADAFAPSASPPAASPVPADRAASW
ncbi:MAG TPA: glycosyltransferase family 2 protein [Longimicrobiales bacterium]|nr:glycosyltransferase family 2 protein [Longimicrobiales bacterium]